MKTRLFTVLMLCVTGSLVVRPITAHANTSCLAEADALYNKNERPAAEKRYRQCKKPFPEEENNTNTFFPTPISDPSKLSPSGQTLWENAQGDSRTAVVPLQQLNQQHPWLKLSKILTKTRKPSKFSNKPLPFSPITPTSPKPASRLYAKMENAWMLLLLPDCLRSSIPNIPKPKNLKNSPTSIYAVSKGASKTNILPKALV